MNLTKIGNSKKINVLFLGGGNIAHIVKTELGEFINRCWYFDIKETGLECQYINTFKIPNDVDIVVECASVEALREYGIDVLESGKDFYIISTGAFSDDEFRANFTKRLENSNSRVFIPSGAIGGLDIIAAIRNYITNVTLTTRKPPKALGLEHIEEEKIVFSGSAKDAIKLFPQNTNVSVTLSLAVGSFEKVNVQLIADPRVDQNVHEIKVCSQVGEYTIIHKNKPSPNPKTSYLAPLSLASEIKKQITKFVI